ncbi:TorF family putative porin [Kordiimonas sp. SCSIO 12603]|uniref:TorF family putative porin n=1 Tax=Kordiimonas sp. SCSIO 12603 TaxID=2829596 RepID=UPI002107B245|nr:TorF family putative porin [Kordiimonas sp. SCSIO 12603]UTW57089.1 TorF family putative porin [Kordiimonas sp. SCSIO 12603]
MKLHQNTNRNAVSSKTTLGLFAFALGVFSAPALAQNSGNDFSFSGSATFVSDYRFRGLSLSDKDFAIQGGLNLNHKSGFYVSTWASSIQEFAGSETELDLYGGYSGSIGNLSTNVGIIAYIYPGSDNTTYYEVYGSVSGTMKNISWTLGSAYAWDQNNIGGQDNIYVYLSGSRPLGNSGVSVNGYIGYEDGAFGTDKWDWNAGLSYSFQRYTLGVSYVDTNTGSGTGSAGVIASISASF